MPKKNACNIKELAHMPTTTTEARRQQPLQGRFKSKWERCNGNNYARIYQHTGLQNLASNRTLNLKNEVGLVTNQLVRNRTFK